MRYPVSGTATQAVPPNTGTGATGTTTVLSVSSGRIFWCRGVSFPNAATDGPLELYDATVQSTATGHPIRVILSIPLTASGPSVVKEFAPPGIKFSGGYVLARLANSGSLPLGGLTVWGYEE